MNRALFALTFCGCLLTLSAAGQPVQKKLREFPLTGISRVSIDRLGDFYLMMSDGSFKKYDPDGNLMGQYSNPDHLGLTLLEPWNPLRIFVYAREQQQIVLLDHSLEVLQKIRLDPAWAIEPVLASQSSDNNFWIMDAADFSLKKIETRTNSVLRETTLNLEPGATPEFIFLREYQGFLFLIDKRSGVYIFNAVGTLIHKAVSKDLGYIGFLGEEFYYLENGKLKFFDLDTEATREINVDSTARFVLVTDERMIVIRPDLVQVFEFKL